MGIKAVQVDTRLGQVFVEPHFIPRLRLDIEGIREGSTPLSGQGWRFVTPSVEAWQLETRWRGAAPTFTLRGHSARVKEALFSKACCNLGRYVISEVETILWIGESRFALLIRSARK
jgi:hypothetical protein